MKLDNQIAIVTGGASGMGAACVQALRECGLRVMVWDIKTATSGEDDIICDVCSEESVENALYQTKTRAGIPRVVINCAGIAPARRMVNKEGAMPLADFKRVIEVNLIGTFNVMRLTAAAMMELAPLQDSDERGVIINTASIAAFEGQIGQLAYSASKGGVVAMTLPAARELARNHIRVNTIAPGLIETPLFLGMTEEVKARLAETVPFPHRLGKPKEFAALAIHMLENSLLNGEVIRLDGALRLQP